MWRAANGGAAFVEDDRAFDQPRVLRQGNQDGLVGGVRVWSPYFVSAQKGARRAKERRRRAEVFKVWRVLKVEPDLGREWGNQCESLARL